ncbi:MAG: linear amide C-N hydrolase [Romboutsia sp.]
MCTNITVKYADGYIAARTNEFGIFINSNIFTISRNTKQRGFCTEENKGLAWENKYGFIGLDGEILTPEGIALDGMNEEGLSIQGLYFPNYAKYQNTENYDIAVTNLTFPNYILGLFKTVDEVKEGLKNIVICGESIHGEPSPFHFQINDKNGGCIVVEIERGKIFVYDNKIGVMTNSPSFSFHETNYKNYINLSPYNVEKIDFNGDVLYQTGQGSGQLGLPGDMTPPSRFIRATFNQVCAVKCRNNEEAVSMAFRILNSFDIVPGTCRHKAGKKEIDMIGREKLILTDEDDICEMTQIVLAKDLNNFTLYFKDYYNMNIKKIDCREFDLTKGGKVIRGKIFDDYIPKYIDITDKLK